MKWIFIGLGTVLLIVVAFILIIVAVICKKVGTCKQCGENVYAVDGSPWSDMCEACYFNDNY